MASEEDPQYESRKSDDNCNGPDFTLAVEGCNVYVYVYVHLYVYIYDDDDLDFYNIYIYICIYIFMIFLLQKETFDLFLMIITSIIESGMMILR